MFSGFVSFSFFQTLRSPPYLAIFSAGEPSRAGARQKRFCMLHSRPICRPFLFRCLLCFPCLVFCPKRRACRCCPCRLPPKRIFLVLLFALSSRFHRNEFLSV